MGWIYFLRGLWIKCVLFAWALIVFPICCCLFVEIIKTNISLASGFKITYSTSSENSSSKPLQDACSGCQVAACDSGSCSESFLWFWKWLCHVLYTGKNSDAAFETSPELKVFSLTIENTLPVTRFRKIVLPFRYPPVTLKVVPKASHVIYIR